MTEHIKCFRTFDTKSERANHISYIYKTFNSKPFECKICLLKCKSNATLKNHMNSMHVPKVPVNCQICNKEFSNKEFLKKHVKRVHERIMKAKCDKCNKEFHNNKDLRVHYKAIHQKVKNHF